MSIHDLRNGSVYGPIRRSVHLATRPRVRHLQTPLPWRNLPPAAITVCHYPPGTSKWNKIEHRMFSDISLNWRGEPLVSYETVVNLISATRTRTGLKVKAMLDERTYETGLKISDEDLRRVSLKRHRTQPNWNYTIAPTHGQT